MGFLKLFLGAVFSPSLGGASQPAKALWLQGWGLRPHQCPCERGPVPGLPTARALLIRE